MWEFRTVVAMEGTAWIERTIDEDLRSVGVKALTKKEAHSELYRRE